MWLPQRAFGEFLNEPNWDSPQAVDLAHWWPLAGHLGGLTTPDLVGGAEGALQNMELDDWVVDEETESLLFGGTNEYIDCGSRNTSDGASQYTITAWIYRTASTQSPAIGHGDATNGRIFGFRYSATGRIYFTVGGSTNRKYVADTALALNQWLHLAMVYDGTQATAADRIKIYASGTEVASTAEGTIPTTANTINSNLYVGRTTGLGSFVYADCRLADVRWYTRALTAGELAHHVAPETEWDLWEPPRRRWRAAAGAGSSPQTITPPVVTVATSVTPPGVLIELPNSNAWLRVLVNVNAKYADSYRANISISDLLATDVSAADGTFAENQTDYDAEIAWYAANRPGLRVGRYVSSHYATLQNDLETAGTKHYYPYRAAWRDDLDADGLSLASRDSTAPADSTSDYYDIAYDGANLGIAVNFKKTTARASILDAIEDRLAAFSGPRVAFLDNVATYTNAFNKYHTDAEIVSYLTELTARCHRQSHRAIANITPAWGTEDLVAAADYAAAVDGCSLENAIAAVTNATQAANAVDYITEWMAAGKLVVLLQPQADFDVFGTTPAVAETRGKQLAAICMVLREPGDKLFTAWPYWAGTQPYVWFNWPTVLGAPTGAYSWPTTTSIRREFAGGRLTVDLVSQAVEWVQTITPPVVTVATSVVAPTVTPGAVTLAPPVVTVATSVVEPSISTGGGPQTIVPPVVTVATPVVAPGISASGAATISVPVITVATSVVAPAITGGDAPEVVVDAEFRLSPQLPLVAPPAGTTFRASGATEPLRSR